MQIVPEGQAVRGGRGGNRVVGQALAAFDALEPVAARANKFSLSLGFHEIIAL